MPIDTWIAFIAASSLVLIIPGPTIATVLAFSLSQGRRVVPKLALAVGLGHATTLSLSLAGLGTVLVAAPQLFNGLKIVGALYLLYLIVSVVRSEPTQSASLNAVQKESNAFIKTWLVTAANPQTIVFFVAFLPQFVSPTQQPTQQLLCLCISFVGLAMLNSLLFGYFAQATVSRLRLRVAPAIAAKASSD